MTNIQNVDLNLTVYLPYPLGKRSAKVVRKRIVYKDCEGSRLLEFASHEMCQ